MTLLKLARCKAQWVTLMQLEGGVVQMKFRPASAAEEDLARDRAGAAARQMSTEHGIMAHYGFEDAAFQEIWLDGEDAATGAGLVMFATELALIVGSDFRILIDAITEDDTETVKRPLDENDQPAEWNRRNIAILLGERAEPPHTISLATRFVTLACGASNLERHEGNGLAAGQNMPGPAASLNVPDAPN